MWECNVSWTNDYISATGNIRDQKIESSWASFQRYKQELTSRSYFLPHRLRLFNMVITPTLCYASGTWTLLKQHERMIRSTQRKMLRFIVQTKRKNQKKNQPKRNDEDEEDKSANHKRSDDGIAGSSNTDCDQHSDISFVKRHRWRDWCGRHWRWRLDWIHEEKHSYSSGKDESSQNLMLNWDTQEEWNGAWPWELHRYQMNNGKESSKMEPWLQHHAPDKQTSGKTKEEMGRWNEWHRQAGGNWRDDRQWNKKQRHLENGKIE